MKIPWMFMDRERDFYGNQLTDSVMKVIDRGDFINGEEVKAFEAEFSNLNPGYKAISCGNGTDAITLALMTEGLDYKPEVIVPSYTFVATVDAVIRAGGTPVFADVSPETWVITKETVENLINKKTKAVIGVSIFGHAIDWKEFVPFGIPLIEDAAQSFGTNRPESIPNYKTFSFHPTKNLGAYGDAGAILAKDENDIENLKSIRQHGMSKQNKYLYEALGMNSRLDTIQAAVLLHKLKRFLEVQFSRMARAYEYHVSLRCKTNFSTSKNNHQFVLKFDTQTQRDKVKQAMVNTEIANCIFYPTPIHKQYPFKIHSKNKLPVTEELCNTTLAIPISPFLTSEEQNFIIRTINEAI